MKISNDWIAEDNARVVEALRFAGLRVTSIDELVNTSQPYPAAIPVLSRMLTQVRHPRIKEAIARALSVKEASTVVGGLVEEFRRMDSPTRDDEAAKWAIGNAIAIAATDVHTEEVIALMSDASHGTARYMLPLALTKARANRALAIDALLQALGDDQTACKAAEALAKMRVGTAVTKIERLADHPNPDIRKAATKALRQLAKS